MQDAAEIVPQRHDTRNSCHFVCLTRTAVQLITGGARGRLLAALRTPVRLADSSAVCGASRAATEQSEYSSPRALSEQFLRATQHVSLQRLFDGLLQEGVPVAAIANSPNTLPAPWRHAIANQPVQRRSCGQSHARALASISCFLMASCRAYSTQACSLLYFFSSDAFIGFWAPTKP